LRRPLLAVVLCFVAVLPAAAQSAPATDDASIGGLFVDLWHDLPRMVMPSNLVILGAGGTTALLLEDSDPSINARISSSDELGELFRGASYPGNGWFQITGAVGTYVVGRVTGNATTLSVGTDLVQAQLLNAAVTTGVKYASNRTRPDGGRNSFPSGHTSSIFANAAVLSRHFGWRVAVPAYGLATYVGVARVQENHHYMSDVVFGAALGLVSGRTVSVGKGSARFQISPALLPGGAGIYLTRK
jgi:membrane-associated phospholipid phosphatase